MNAKELIEAATPSSVLIAAAKDLEHRARQGGSQPTETSDLWIARHILATVRPDDDEPVTRERLEADGCGMKKRVTELGNVYFSLPGSLMAYHPEKNRLFLNGGSVELKVKSMGHLRRLVAALGE